MVDKRGRFGVEVHTQNGLAPDGDQQVEHGCVQRSSRGETEVTALSPCPLHLARILDLDPIGLPLK